MKKPRQLTEIWGKDFGEEYTNRKLKGHDTEGQRRRIFWNELLKMLPDVKSILQIGCNDGMDLEGMYKGNRQQSIVMKA